MAYTQGFGTIIFGINLNKIQKKRQNKLGVFLLYGYNLPDMNNILKKCRTCLLEKELNYFGKLAAKPDGLRSECKDCRKKHYYKNHDLILEQKRIDHSKHRDERLAKQKIYYDKNREKMIEKANNHYYKNHEYWLEYGRKRRQDPEVKKLRNQHYHDIIKKDPRQMIEKRLRGRLRDALKKTSTIKSRKTLDLLGCAPVFLKTYLESKFTPNMSWEAFLKAEIHIDHIKPCASFDLTNPEQQKVCFHYTNLQPLWAKDNSTKWRHI